MANKTTQEEHSEKFLLMTCMAQHNKFIRQVIYGVILLIIALSSYIVYDHVLDKQERNHVEVSKNA